ncbi:hypothetical protein BDA99DRAFT_566755 [Phascolomyces articulosus]|uniref:Uncharacterized protein n=1 Tax=Phascolomyces articulosus TaxID=60185 RepID=A0AAD5JL82_9FUNG|nr:hypothetical protein BDA99DRAFT_566755 [Phascolomyces articulosus]
MSTPATTNMYRCYCEICQQRNPGYGVLLTERTYQDHWAASLDRATAADYNRHDDGGDDDMPMDESISDFDIQVDIPVQEASVDDDGGDNIGDDTMIETIHDEGDVIPSESFFDPEREVHHTVVDDEMNMADDAEFDVDDTQDDDQYTTDVHGNEDDDANIPSSINDPLDYVQHPLIYVFVFIVLFQIHHISERTAAILISFIGVLIGGYAGEIVRRSVPKTIAAMKKWIGFNKLTTDFIMYSACPTCHAIYPLPGPERCTEPHQRLDGTLCDTELLKPSNNNHSRRPLKQYAYNPLEQSLRRLFMRKGFEENIEQ